MSLAVDIIYDSKQDDTTPQLPTTTTDATTTTTTTAVAPVKKFANTKINSELKLPMTPTILSAQFSSDPNASISAMSGKATDELLSYQPKVVCNCKCRGKKFDLERKDLIEYIGLLIIIITVLTYFVYEMFFQYLNTKTNRKTYTLDEQVDEIPLPFFYLGYYYADMYHRVYPYRRDIDANTSYVSYEWLDSTLIRLDLSGTYDTGDTNSSFEDILTTNISNTWVIIEGIHYSKGQALLFLIPPKNAVIDPKSKETYGISFYSYCYDTTTTACSETAITGSSSYVWYAYDHRDQLDKFDTIADALWDYYWLCDYLYNGYEIAFSYEWISYDNQVDPPNKIGHDQTDYFNTFVESTFDLDIDSYYYDSAGNQWWYVLNLQFAPDGAGRKTTYVTARQLEFYEVFSLAGGMLSAVNTIIGLFLVYLVWGVDLYCCKINGLGKNSDPSKIERRKFQGFIARYVANYVRTEMDQRDNQIKKLKLRLKEREQVIDEKIKQLYEKFEKQSN